MMDSNSPHSDEMPRIKHGRVDSVNLYEVKEHELEILGKGQVGTLQWWRTKVSITEVVSTIRNRIDDDLIGAQTQEESENQPKESDDETPNG